MTGDSRRDDAGTAHASDIARGNGAAENGEEINVIGRITHYVGATFKRLHGPVSIVCVRRGRDVLVDDEAFGGERGLQPSDEIGVTYTTDSIERPSRLYFVSPADLECFSVIGTHTRFYGENWPEAEGLQNGRLVEIRYVARDSRLYARDRDFGGAPGITAKDWLEVVQIGVDGQPLGEHVAAIEAQDVERFAHLRETDRETQG
jgi:hypothetical protein